MSIMTVVGAVDEDALGAVLPHEHVFMGLAAEYTETADNAFHSEGGPLGELDDGIASNDLEIAVEELKYFKGVGGKTVVDCTSVGLGRSPERLRYLAERTGLNLIAGCGYYKHGTYPEQLECWSVGKIADDMIRDLAIGMDGTTIRAGVIGEIGISDPIHPQEKRVLYAVGAAYEATNSPIQLRTSPWSNRGVEAVDTLIRCGVCPNRIAVCHADVKPDLESMKSLLEMGVYLDFDNFGKDAYVSPGDPDLGDGPFATDLERVIAIMQLIDWGYEDRILIGNDICVREMLHKFGGWGYDHVLSCVVPMMAEEGIPKETINKFIRDNPAAWLS